MSLLVKVANAAIEAIWRYPLDYYTHLCILNMKRRELEKRLQALGWEMIRRGGRHDIWARNEYEIAVPRHPEINEFTAKAILRAAEGGSR